MERMSRLVRQHAETARLMGTDCVPVYRSGAGAAVEVEQAQIVEVPVATVAAARPVETLNQTGVATDERERARLALDELRKRYEREAPHKAFVTAFKNIVFGEGDPCARLMFIGEAPGEEEDKTGRPFVGRAGQLLNKMIAAMGLSREQVYICNVLKTRPLNNATPTPGEAAACEPYLMEQVAIVAPEVIVTLGLPASRLVLKSDNTMSNLRGRWASLAVPGKSPVAVMPTYHPAFVLRSYTPENRGKVWSDLKQVMDRLGLQSPATAAPGDENAIH